MPDYALPGPLTRIPDEYGELVSNLPDDPAALCGWIQGVLLHPDLGSLYGVDLDEARRQQEPELRPVGALLTRIAELGSGSLEPRSPERRALGTCRSFSTLLCALLRHKGQSARARCGFGEYFLPGRAEDHWICEVWCDGRWVRVDAQVDAEQRRAFGIALDPLDVGEGFVLAGEAWRSARRGVTAWDRYGLTVIAEHGVWWVLSNLIRDVAALHKLELLPWDEWGLMQKDVGADPFTLDAEAALAKLTGEELSQLDQLAELSARVPTDVDALVAGVADRVALRPPRVVVSARSGAHDLGPWLGSRIS